jgi:hypothetical protein
MENGPGEWALVVVHSRFSGSHGRQTVGRRAKSCEIVEVRTKVRKSRGRGFCASWGVLRIFTRMGGSNRRFAPRAGHPPEKTCVTDHWWALAAAGVVLAVAGAHSAPDEQVDAVADGCGVAVAKGHDDDTGMIAAGSHNSMLEWRVGNIT